MPVDKVIGNGLNVRGHVSLWRVDEKTGLRTPLHDQHNQIQYSWGHIAARQLGYRRAAGRPDYFISGVYLEFENVGAPEDEVTVAAFDRDLTTSYYDDLEASSTQDFLRIPLIIEPTLGISTGFEDHFTSGIDGNKLTFHAQSVGTAGVHGKTFSHLVNSKVYAAALIATPVFADRTQDVIFARTIFEGDDQVTKEVGAQIGITWDIAFE